MMPVIEQRLTTQPSVQLTPPTLRRLIWITTLLMWLPFAAIPAVAAVSPTFEEQLNVKPMLMILALVISSLSGATALLMRIDRELSASPDKPLPHPWIMSVSHMSGSWLAGTASFLMSQQLHWDVWGVLGFVLVASFASAKFLEAAFEWYMPKKLIIKEPDAPQP